MTIETDDSGDQLLWPILRYLALMAGRPRVAVLGAGQFGDGAL